MIRRKNVADEIATVLQRRIVELNLKEGDKLPSHDVLAQELGVSKASLREGLQKLSVMGLIDLRQGLGTIVTTPSLSNFIKLLSPRLVSMGSSLSDLFKARRCIETFTAAEAALNRDPKSVTRMRSLLGEMDQAMQSGDTEAFSRADVKFHKAITKAAGNQVLEETLNVITELILFHENLIHRIPGGIERSARFHLQIFEAITEGKPDAAREAMEKHIEDVKSQRTQDLIIYCDSLGAGSIGGTFFSVGTALSKVISKYTWVKAKTEPSGGGIDNLIKVDERSFGLGITQSDIAWHAYQGMGEFKKRYTNIRAVCGAHHLDMQIATLAKTNIRSIRDLAGKRVALGAPGGGSRWVSDIILREYGLRENDYTPEYLPYSKAISALGEEHIDAVFFLSGGPSSALLELSESMDIFLLPLHEDMLARITGDHPYWSLSEIASDTYLNQADPVPTLRVGCILITHKDAGEDTVFSIVKSLMEHTDEIAAEHPAGADYCMDKALDGITIPIHAGARKYFMERNIIHPILQQKNRLNGQKAQDEKALKSKGYWK